MKKWGLLFSLLLLLPSFAFADETITWGTSVGGGWGFSRSDTGTHRIAQRFNVASHETDVVITLTQSRGDSGVVDPYKLKIVGDISGFPNDSDVKGETTADPSALPTDISWTCASYDDLTYTISGLDLSPGNYYYAVMSDDTLYAPDGVPVQCTENSGTDFFYVETGSWTGYSSKEFVGNAVFTDLGGGGGGATSTASTTATTFPFDKQEMYFIFAIFLFIASVPFWDRSLRITDGRYDV